LAELARGGTTVFLSSHLLGEVEMICTHAAMMNQGRLVVQDTVEHLLAPTGRLVVDTPDADVAIALLAEHNPMGDREGDRFRVELNGQPPEELNRALVRAGVRVRELVVERRSLEDAYLGLTGGSGDARR